RRRRPLDERQLAIELGVDLHQPLFVASSGTGLTDVRHSILLPHMVAQRAALHPSHGKSIDERTPHAVPHAVLRYAVPARPVADRDLTYGAPLHLDQRRQETMHPREQGQRLHGLGSERLERAAGIANHLAVEAIAHAIRDAA